MPSDRDPVWRFVSKVSIASHSNFNLKCRLCSATFVGTAARARAHFFEGKNKCRALFQDIPLATEARRVLTPLWNEQSGRKRTLETFASLDAVSRNVHPRVAEATMLEQARMYFISLFAY